MNLELFNTYPFGYSTVTYREMPIVHKCKYCGHTQYSSDVCECCNAPIDIDKALEQDYEIEKNSCKSNEELSVEILKLETMNNELALENKMNRLYIERCNIRFTILLLLFILNFAALLIKFS